MIEEELKRRQYDTWNKYYQKHKSEINARRKKVREDYKNKLSVTENRLAKAKALLKEWYKIAQKNHACCYGFVKDTGVFLEEADK